MIIPTTSQLFIYKLTLSLKVLLTKTTLLGLLFLLTITFSYISCWSELSKFMDVMAKYIYIYHLHKVKYQVIWYVCRLWDMVFS